MNTANNQTSEHSAEVCSEQLFRSEVVQKLGEMGIRHSTGEYTSKVKLGEMHNHTALFLDKVNKNHKFRHDPVT